MTLRPAVGNRRVQYTRRARLQLLMSHAVAASARLLASEKSLSALHPLSNTPAREIPSSKPHLDESGQVEICRYVCDRSSLDCTIGVLDNSDRFSEAK